MAGAKVPFGVNGSGSFGYRREHLARLNTADVPASKFSRLIPFAAAEAFAFILPIYKDRAAFAPFAERPQ